MLTTTLIVKAIAMLVVVAGSLYIGKELLKEPKPLPKPTKRVRKTVRHRK